MKSSTLLLGAYAILAGACSGTPGVRGAAGAGGGAGAGGAGGETTIAGAGGVAGVLAGDGGGQVGGGGVGGTPYCGQLTRTLGPLPPDILILLDRSGSMDNDINDMSCLGDAGVTVAGCGPSSKWALMTPVLSQVVAETESAVNWGLKFFADPGNSTCGVNNNVSVPIGPGNAAAIGAAIAGQTKPEGGLSNGSRTPTNAAEKGAVSYLGTVTDANPKFILLATDGLPNCPPGSATQTSDDSAGAIAAVQTAFDAGIPTFVIGIATAGLGTADTTLSAMANAGGYPRSGSPSYYPVSTPQELTTTLSTLVGAASTTCTFALGPLPTDDGSTSLGRITVFVDGVRLDRDTGHVGGWDYTEATMASITLYGSVCGDVMSGAVHAVTVAFTCLDV